MAEGSHGPVLEKFEFSHVRDKPYGVSAVLNPVRMASKRSAKELRSSPRFNGSTDDIDNDKYCLSAGYFLNSDEKKTKHPFETIVSSAKKNDMEQRLTFFGMPVSFPSASQALEYTAVYKVVVESCKVPLPLLPAWKKTKESSDEQWAQIEMCNSHRSSGQRLRTAHGCLGSLQIKF